MNAKFDPSHRKDEWLTPPEVLYALGRFDLDPCAPIKRPWPTAARHFTIRDNGLKRPWQGRVWCNPPYSRDLSPWLSRCAAHGNVIALIFARTETKCFFKYVWDAAHAVLFLKGRISFYTINGEIRMNSGAPSVLIAYDQKNAEVLRMCSLRGKFIALK